MPNRFIPIQAGTDQNQQLAVINKNFAELDAENVKKLFYDSNGVPSIQIGVQANGSSAIRVSKAGINVTTATDADLAFNSAQNTFKIAQRTRVLTTSAFTFTCPAGQKKSFTQLDTYGHGLGFTPQIVGSLLFGSSYYPLPVISSNGTTSVYTAQVVWYAFASSTSLNVALDHLIDGTDSVSDLIYNVPSYSFRLYLLQETAD